VKPAPKRRSRTPRKKAEPAETKTAAAADAVEAAAEGNVDQIKPERRTRARPAQDAEEAA
jgi:hypothetical protein